MTKVFIIDDHDILRESIRGLLEWESDLEVCGEAASSGPALDFLKSMTPDLVLLDVSLPGMSGIELVKVLHERYPGLPVAMLSGHSEKSHIKAAMDAGARGYIFKTSSGQLPQLIRRLMLGERLVC
jgi:DNA-binding NarL/FixJ family response regulator